MHEAGLLMTAPSPCWEIRDYANKIWIFKINKAASKEFIDDEVTYL